MLIPEIKTKATKTQQCREQCMMTPNGSSYLGALQLVK